jgi:hypothetical protein
MAISFSDFLTQVRNFTEVDSNVLTDTIIGQFIRNIELDVAGKVDYDDTRKYATSSFTTGKRFLVTPSDFLVIRSLQVFSTTSISTGDRTFMEKRDTSFITEYNGTGATGVPKYYANWDESSIVVAPTPNLDYAVQLNYIITPPSFTSSNNTYLSEYQQGMLLDVCTIYIKVSIMKVYRILLSNKWGEEDEQNTMMVYQGSKCLHRHQTVKFKGEILWQ